MKHQFLIIFFIVSCSIKAQIHEIGLVGGTSNYVGDIGRTDYFYPVHGAFGMIYKWNRSTRHSYRFSLIHTKIDGNDEKSELNYRLQRGFKFINNITEASVGLEFNFLEFDLHQLDNPITPYVSTGFSAFLYDSMYYVNKKASILDENTLSFAIPITVGVKARLNRRFILGIEAGARYTFTDNIDGSSPKNSNQNLIITGNQNSNDWYIFSLATLTYTFGRKPCFCPQ